MAWGRRVHAVASVAAVLGFCCVLLLSPPPAYADDTEGARAIVFSGRDVWLNGAFLNGGVLWSPTTLDDDGLLLKLLLSGGLYRYNAGDLGGERVIGSEWAVQLLPGWHIKRGTFEAKIFAGPEFQQHRLWPADPGNRLSGSQFGLRLSGEIWFEPTATTMVAGDAPSEPLAIRLLAASALAGRCSICSMSGPRRRPTAPPAIRNGDWAPMSPVSRPVMLNGRPRAAWQSTATTVRALTCVSASCSASAATSRASGGSGSPRWSLRSASARTWRLRRSAGRSPTIPSA